MIPTSVVDNFFDNFHNLIEEFKKIKLYTLEESKELGFIPKGVVWPGKRSDVLNVTHPFFFNFRNHPTQWAHHHLLVVA